MYGVAESLTYGLKAGLKPEKIVEILMSGASRSFVLDYWGRQLANREWEPNAFIETFVKDIGIAVSEAKRMGISLPGANLVENMNIAAMAQEGPKAGVQVIGKMLERLNNIDYEEVKKSWKSL